VQVVSRGAAIAAEAWVRTRDNDRAIVAEPAGAGRVITAAAAILIVVFARSSPPATSP
jgi:putative drug exporter of the RND superfamily